MTTIRRDLVDELEAAQYGDDDLMFLVREAARELRRRRGERVQEDFAFTVENRGEEARQAAIEFMEKLAFRARTGRLVNFLALPRDGDTFEGFEIAIAFHREPEKGIPPAGDVPHGT